MNCVRAGARVFCHHIGSVLDGVGVIANAADEGVGHTSCTCEGIIKRTADNNLNTRQRSVISCATCCRSICSIAKIHVHRRSGGGVRSRVDARTAIHRVIARTTNKGVVATSTNEGVVATAAIQQIGTTVAGYAIGTGTADDCFKAR